ncbi:hypothetical protein RHSIM_Rhsim07G0004500 [Rhododendron simsii]|uniref:RING-type domain-containing protein n=1 Tax=Rhododendron simsii TaxID=118357 RepID=A0A834GPM3_RHOSS|nr:hypothetical protein RHSIM_Rhsim07G0004500 [Rhododendron simsii]
MGDKDQQTAVNSSPSNCPTSICFNSNFTIRFPFQAVPGASPNCVYPGFNLSCDNQGNTVIRFPYISGEFFVRSIDYQAQEIQLYDPSNCLPRRLLDFNLSGTPFRVAYHINYTFMVCPTAFTQSRFTAVQCLSNSTNTTLATFSNSLVEILSSKHCKVLVTMPIPVSSPTQSDSGFTSGLNGDLQLYWDVPNCEDCEAKGFMCGFENNTSQQVMCFDSPGTDMADHLRLLKMISLTVAIPTIVCAVCTACICLIHGRQSHGMARQQNFDPTVTLQPSDTSISGLDQSSIESYTKVVLGESRRLPMGPNDGTCPICLSDYRAEEVVRCIPECQHCFHAGCIDVWLRLNNSCPVCRNSPSPAHCVLQPV